MDGRQCTYTERKYTYPYGPEMIKVRATEGKGYLTIKSCRQPKANIGTVEKIDENTWRLWIDTPEERIVSGLKY